MTAGVTVYAIDSSSLIKCRRVYPIDVFPALWSEMDGLIQAGRLIAQEEVWIEIHKGTDFLTQWAARWRTELSVGADGAQVGMVAQIAADYPQANYTTTTEHRADPWIVALARTRACSVVSEEGGTSPVFPKVPQMCARYDVPHVNILAVMRAESWAF